MKKAVLLISMIAFLLLCACGSPAAEEAVTTEASSVSALQPMSNWQEPAREEIKLSKTKTIFVCPQTDEAIAHLLLRDETTGKETVIAQGMDFGAPFVAHMIDERYVVWTDNFKDNGYGGIYDTERMADISWGDGVFPIELDENALWFESTAFHYGGQLSLYRVALDGLDTAKKIDLGRNLLEDIPEADLDCLDIRWTEMSPDCRYYAVRGAAVGVYVFDLQRNALVKQLPPEEIPGETPGRPPRPFNDDPMPYLRFADSKTLLCYKNSDESDAIQIILE